MLLLKQMMILFFVMLVGWIARRQGIIDEHAGKKLSSIVVNIANPAMILSGVMGENTISKAQYFRTMGIAIGMYVVLLILAAFLPKVLRIENKSQKGIYKLMLIFSNIGFMGFPIISAAYGKEALLYATLFILPYNVLIYTYGIYIIKPDGEKDGPKGGGKQILRRICNIGVLSCLMAILIYLSGFKTPDMIVSVMDMLGGLTAPLSMLVIGASFYQMDFKALFTDVRLLVFTGIKLLLVPVAGIFLLRQYVSEPMLLGVCLVMLSTPVGSMNAMLAQEYGGDTVLPSRGVAITTLLSVITIPIVSAICGL